MTYGLAPAFFGAMSDGPLGTPVYCPACKHEGQVRLFKGTRLKSVRCEKCGNIGLKRNTEYDKKRREKKR